MNLVFKLNLERFAQDPIKVVYIISRLYGSTMNWTATLIENNDLCLNKYEQYTSRFKATFKSYDSTFIANQKLKTVKQHRWNNKLYVQIHKIDPVIITEIIITEIIITEIIITEIIITEIIITEIIITEIITI